MNKRDLQKYQMLVEKERQTVLEKLGMTREGNRRKILPIRGEWKDNYHYAILEEEYNIQEHYD